MKKIFRDVTNNKGEIHSVMITLDDDGEVVLGKSLCSCEFGSWWRFATFWKKQNKICRHMSQVIDELNRRKQWKKKHTN